MRKFRPFIGLIAVFLMLSACGDVPEEFTLQEFQHLIGTRYAEDSLDCGTSDTTNGYSEQSNPEVVTCLHNALANGQFAHGFFVSESTYSRTSQHWTGYSLSSSEVERVSLSRFLDTPEDTKEFINTNRCNNPEITASPSSSLHIFDCYFFAPNA